MLNEDEPRAGIYLLPFGGSQSVAWDARQQCLTFTFGPSPDEADVRHTPAAASESAVIRLDSFANFKKDVPALLRRLDPGGLELRRSQSEGVPDEVYSPALRDAVGRFAFLLLRYGLKDGDARAKETAKGLLRDLGPDGEETAWRLQYNESLTHEYRHKLLEQAYLRLQQRYRGERSGDSPEIDSSEVELREAYWWTVRCLNEVALDWDKLEGVSNPEARRAMRRAATAYLGTLKDEPRTRDLERFLAECGTSLEEEVKNIILPAKNWRQVSDEVVGRIFVSWFLRRYDMMSAWALGLRMSSKRSELILLLAAFALLVWSVYLFFLQTPHRYVCLTATPFLTRPCTSLFVLQLGLQLLALLVAVVGANTFFRLLMPRALFGTFLSWLTIILLSVMPGLGQASVYVGAEKENLAKAFQGLLVSNDAPEIYDLLLPFIIAPLALSCVFIANEVNNYVRDRKAVAIRTVIALIIIYLGALFWGVAFALPVKYMLEGAIDPPTVTGRWYLWRIALAGSSLAVLFGLLVQLLWEDKSITEPIGEPL
jgi:hypothetical protein